MTGVAFPHNDNVTPPSIIFLLLGENGETLLEENGPSIIFLFLLNSFSIIYNLIASPPAKRTKTNNNNNNSSTITKAATSTLSSSTPEESAEKLWASIPEAPTDLTEKRRAFSKERGHIYIKQHSISKWL